MDVKDSPTSHRLDRLNAAERDILRLFTGGHTAKSIATLRGLSVAAVNERLRAARRKTGVGSSRELARLLAAQENRDDLIGLAPTPASSPASSDPDVRPPRRASLFRHWRVAMTALVLIAAAVLAQQTALPAQGGSAVASLASEQAQQPDPDSLRAAASGDRDPEWSAAAEARLTRRYEGVRNFSRLVKSLTVRCSRNVCEVEGVVNRGGDMAELDGLHNDLQTLGQNQAVEGLDQIIHVITMSDMAPPGFLSYWRKDD